jgi:hypothetical protein
MEHTLNIHKQGGKIQFLTETCILGQKLLIMEKDLSKQN